MAGTGRTATLDDPGRLAAVARYEVLDAPRDGAFERVARLAAAAFGTPIASVTIVDRDRVWFAAAKGLDGVAQVGVEPGLCASVVLDEGESYVVADAADDPRTLEHPLVREGLGLRFYAAAPIVTGDGFRLGTVNVIDREPHDPDGVDTGVLRDLAAIVAEHLDLRLAAIKAVRAERDRRADADRRAQEAAHRVAAMAVAVAEQHSASRPQRCERNGVTTTCHAEAKLKVADRWGEQGWLCPRHAEELLMRVPWAFIADEEQSGVASYLTG